MSAASSIVIEAVKVTLKIPLIKEKDDFGKFMFWFNVMSYFVKNVLVV